MDDKLRKDVEAVVAKIFSEKEEVEIRRQTEDALSRSATTIEELTSALEAKNSEVEDFEEKLTESEDKANNLQTELEAAQEKIEEANQKLEESEKALEEIKKDRAAELRMRELEEAGIVSDKEAQSTKVREMSDDEFASYKDELVSIREAVIAELSKAKDGETDEEKAAREKQEQEDAAAAEAEDAEAEDAEEDGSDTPPANIDPGQAIQAALNMEIFPDKDLVAKYNEMGKAMASLMTNQEEKSN